MRQGLMRAPLLPSFSFLRPDAGYRSKMMKTISEISLSGVSGEDSETSIHPHHSSHQFHLGHPHLEDKKRGLIPLELSHTDSYFNLHQQKDKEGDLPKSKIPRSASSLLLSLRKEKKTGKPALQLPRSSSGSRSPFALQKDKERECCAKALPC